VLTHSFTHSLLNYTWSTSNRTPLNARHANADFTVQLEVHLEFVGLSSNDNQYVLVASAEFDPTEQTQAIVPPSHAEKVSSIRNFTMTAPADQVELWWPNGMGAQPLYHVDVSIRNKQQQQEEEWSAVSQNRKLVEVNHTWVSKRIGRFGCGALSE
jgi:Glycosyl hydrolases family 2